MSREGSEASLPDWIRQKLATLRQQATEPEQWPETADQLLDILTEQTSPQVVDESDMDMFSLAVQDTLAGVDISQRYPAFFEKMVANPALYRAFLDAIDILEGEERGTLASVPGTTKNELTFLEKETAPQPTIEQTKSGGWRITWKLLLAQLQQVLFPSSELVFRRTTPLLEDDSIILIHDEVGIDNHPLEAVLEALRPVAQPEILQLHLMVAGETPLPPLMASLRWGEYEGMTVLDNYGRAQFPPLALADLLDDNDRLQIKELQLVLELKQT